MKVLVILTFVMLSACFVTSSKDSASSSASSASAEDSSAVICDEDTLETFKTSLFIEAFVDGVLATDTGKKFKVATGSNVLAFKVDNSKAKTFKKAVKKVMTAATGIVCTNSFTGGANTWTGETFDDSNWELLLTPGDLSNDNNDWQTMFATCKSCAINCRAYLKCYVPPATTTTPTTTPTTPTATTAPASTAPVIVSCAVVGTVRGGQPVDLECTFTSDSAVTAVWYFNGIPISSSSNLVSQDSNGNGYTKYTIAEMDITKIGMYKVSLTNAIGVTDGTDITVTVDYERYDSFPSYYQLDKSDPEVILFKTNGGCANIDLKLVPTNNEANVASYPTYNSVTFYPGSAVLINNKYISWPADCNTVNGVWIWIEITATNIRAGLGTTAEKNGLLSSPINTYEFSYFRFGVTDPSSSMVYTIYRQ